MGVIIWLMGDPYCRCFSWSPEEVQWRSRNKTKRVCVICAARRNKYLEHTAT
jgi:hypothetical protein